MHGIDCLFCQMGAKLKDDFAIILIVLNTCILHDLLILLCFQVVST